MMKISFITPHFGYVTGGAEINDLNLGRAFEELGHEVSYFHAYEPGLPCVANASVISAHLVRMRYWYGFAERKAGLPGKILRHLFEHYFLLQLKRQYGQTLKDKSLLLITGRPLLTGVKSVTKAKVLQSVRGTSTPLHYKHYDTADGVIFWGGCENGHPHWRIKGLDFLTLDAAIEHDIFYPAEPEPALRMELKNGREETIVITYTGRLDPIQQVDQIISAVATLSRQGYPVRLIVVGKGHVESSLKAQAQRELLSDAVSFLGLKSRQEVGDILRASDIFIMNPKHTSYSLSLKEAVACGTYAIAPRIGRVAMSLGAGDFAGVFTPNDADEMTRVLRHAVVERFFEKHLRGSVPADFLHTWKDNARAILQWHENKTSSM